MRCDPALTMADAEAQPFHAVASAARLQVWSTAMLSFEPRGWQRDLRTALRAGLADLATGHGLIGRVWDRDGRCDDLENALMYNIGPGLYRSHLAGGLWFRREKAPFLGEPPALTSGPIAAHYEYAHAAADIFPSNAGLAEATTFEVAIHRPVTVLSVWRAARAVLEPLALTGLPLRVGCWVRVPLSFTTSDLKPFLDGVVAALHSADDPSTRLALEGWGIDAPALDRLATWPAPLGHRTRLIAGTATRRNWNPADDRLDEIIVMQGAHGLAQVSVYGMEP